MAKLYDHIDARIADFIKAQKMFFVATAPSGNDGHVNVSPKGYDSFRILGPNRVAYLDLGGSGIETVAHLRQNSRITFMFCAFEGKANILRLYGKGEAICFDDPGFADALAQFPDFPKARAIITADITRIQDSCGWGVPFYDFADERDQLVRTNAHRSDEDWRARRYASNAESIDGLPGLVKPEDDA
ncbi:pyridoxamine 5'-phosphate oxidase family protein [Hyphobacterium sp. CCMP332]|uniref:pyridoxamine 5'-phosphate oxidase family protein n=1 Tax=Hyphobacterium sp. CCMP332 TaxID=2749086 RepID=UPI00164FF6FE|nr:pyridoxamine 5'-phosphate oxidase family protein [Hyphobacterium sp. CCMP332]QNL18417.1 pyridoxamine 5'-phosphate oxidase family protein [Hyphobacterium sp. CCMP332]